MKDLFCCCKLKFIYFLLQWNLHRLVLLLLLLVFVHPRLQHYFSTRRSAAGRVFSEYDIITKKCNSQWVKAWIYFYRLCLKDPFAFALVKKVVFLLNICYGSTTILFVDQVWCYTSDEWRKMFDTWSFSCFKVAGFEIVRTANMGLGNM